MRNKIPAFLFTLCLVALSAKVTLAHCQVPCGIYDDQMRFMQMLEHENTIAKAQAQLGELHGGEVTPQAVNQMARWVMTKEDHATKVQEIVSKYFLTQRIKPDSKDYTKQLVAAHKVMVAAMKCKQSADADTAKTLEKAIFDLYRAYEGKEPDMKHEHK